MPALDGLRGVAILLVLMLHFVILKPTSPTTGWLRAITGVGWMGVDLFFVLSGFLITGILHRTKGSEGWLRKFYARRALRIFPLYFAFIGGYVVLLPRLMPGHPSVAVLLENQAWFWTYTSNFLMAFEGLSATPLYTTAMWSLAIEEQFYLAWPLCVLLLGRDALLRLCVGMVCSAVLFRCGLLVFGAPLAAYVLPFARMDSLAIGAFVALAGAGAGGLEPLVRQARPLGWSVAAILGAAFVAQGELGHFTVFMQTVGYTLVAILFAVVVLHAAARQESWAGRVGRLRCLRFLGTYSYGIYVLHNPVRLVLHQAGLNPKTTVAAGDPQLAPVLLYLSLGVAGSVALAVASWHLFERPVLRLKRHFEYTSAPPPVPAWSDPAVGTFPGEPAAAPAPAEQRSRPAQARS